MDAPDAWLMPRMLDEKIRARVGDARHQHDIPADHSLARSWRTRGSAAGWSYVPFPSGKRVSCHCEATYRTGRVIRVLARERPVPRAQLALPF